jgi:hypothetical protein
MYELKTAILILVYNRPEQFKKLILNLKKIKLKKVYISSDGYNQKTLQEVNEVRKIALENEWGCHVEYNFLDRNYGCKNAVYRGIDWFFCNEEMGIILEDDILPSNTFYRFCDELLEKYKLDRDIALISGNNFEKKFSKTSYKFSDYNFNIWGWASWRRTWELYDLNLSDWNKISTKVSILKGLNGNLLKYYKWQKIFNKLYLRKINTWDYQINYMAYKFKLRSIYPGFNLCKNVGFDDKATNTKIMPLRYGAALQANELSFPLCHPKKDNSLVL